MAHLRAGRQSGPQNPSVIFLLEATWLALNIWVTEHGAMIAAAALCAAQPAAARVRELA